MSTRRSSRYLRLSGALRPGTCLSRPALTTDLNVSNDAQLRVDLNPTTDAQNGDRVVFTRNITVMGNDLPALDDDLEPNSLCVWDFNHG